MMDDKVLHEIWNDDEGLSGLLTAGEECAVARKMFIEEGKKLIHTFYASSYYDAMNYYYKYLGYGEWTTSFEYDKLPYSEWKNIKGEWK